MQVDTYLFVNLLVYHYLVVYPYTYTTELYLGKVVELLSSCSDYNER